MLAILAILNCGQIVKSLISIPSLCFSKKHIHTQIGKSVVEPRSLFKTSLDNSAIQNNGDWFLSLVCCFVP